MSVSLLTPDLRRILDGLASRVGTLERRITSRGASIDESKSIPFCFTGPLTEITSPPIRVWRGGNLAVLAVTFTPGSAGSTDTVIVVLRNDTAVATVTVPADTEIYNGEVSVRYAADSDTIALAVDTAGTDAAGMTCEARFT